MTVRAALRNELFKYRKRKKISLDGSVAGLPRRGFRKSAASYPVNHSTGGYSRNLYNWGQPREYRPRLNSPNVVSSEYQQIDEFTPFFGKTPDIKVAGSSTNTHPGHESPLPEDELALEEQFLSCQGEKAPEFIDERSPEQVLPLKEGVRINSEGKELPNFQGLPEFSQVNNALEVLGQVLPEDHPDIVNLSNVADSLTALGLDNCKQAKPYEIEQTLDTMNSYNVPGGVEDSLRGPQQPLDDQTQPTPEALDDQAQDQSGLETVVDSEMAQLSPGPQMPAAGQPEMDTGYGPDTGMDEVNQAMDNAMQTPAQQPDPVKTQQQYIEEAMYMQNYMMPGQMQMSPGFGPMPGPQI